ncbi:MAG TPA: hypothetical protein VI483_03210 [Candidatus Paceibacterota bacterium]
MQRIKWKEYDYSAQLGPRGSYYHRPLITVEILYKPTGEKVLVNALIDSGTDGDVIHSDIARTLKINPATCRRAELGGIGSAIGFAAIVTIFVPDFNVAMDATVAFVDKLPADALLGQRHFFQRFKIRFEKDKNKFYLAAM